MSIINQLSNSVGAIRDGLQLLSLETPDRILQILDTRARYQSGVAGEGFSFTHLRDTPQVTYYTGADRTQESENDPKTTRIIVPWANMSAPVQFLGTDLHKTVGLTTTDLLEDAGELNRMREDDSLVFIDFVRQQVEATAFSLQQARVNTLWGKDAGINSVSADRLPISLPDIFDETTGLYGESVDALGDFEPSHVWAEDYAFGYSTKKLMTPRIWNFEWEQGGGTLKDGDKVASGATAGQARGILTSTGELDNNAFQDLQQLITAYSQVVQGMKIGICNNTTFNALAIGFRGDQYPEIRLDKWDYTVKCVQIDSVYFISDPSKSATDTTIDIIHIGANGTNQATVFPFYWNPRRTVRSELERRISMRMKDIPDGLSFGARREIPWYMDMFSRFEGLNDAVGTRLRLMMMLICTEPWMQCQIRNIAARSA